MQVGSHPPQDVFLTLQSLFKHLSHFPIVSLSAARPNFMTEEREWSLFKKQAVPLNDLASGHLVFSFDFSFLKAKAKLEINLLFIITNKLS